MQSLIRPTFAAAAALLVCTLCACALARTPNEIIAQDPELIPQAVAKGAWYFRGTSGVAAADNRGFTSNAGFVVTASGVVVFDALGTPALGSEMIDAIAHVTDLPIKLVIISHYHADHIYGLQAFKAAGATIWARDAGQDYLSSDTARERLTIRRQELAPWVNSDTQLIPADRWIRFGDERSIPFEFGGMHFELIDGGDSHSPSDLMLYAHEPSVLFSGDLFFTGRLPYVVGSNTRNWLGALERMAQIHPRVVVPGHGAASHAVENDLKMTYDYLQFLRQRMGDAAAQLEDFDEAYVKTDWSAFANLPTFADANRRNAYSVFLEMQAELLEAPPH
ncbi:MBL fold metallo-hydrolase [Sinimarinibacterium sp. CAU 1509]|uniref:MBL fold metallo-hydrolase n=1 Tax=Sinimarinibacterium sp. CAU 1509 TaxID=2562283 RepID=UPI0010AD1FC8|nr:MBL fold metallo-hydrolase [Sinimarinibacterium sp. CAU 1509]TJY64836.1 MBL fold metallo-hydrolase [Sinimarinibacterium sp. CAU 1509]